MPLNDGNLDLPYESHGEQVLEDQFLMSGGVVVMAATLNVEGRAEPSLIFRFAQADGSGFLPPVLLCVDDEQMKGLIDLVEKAATDAVTAAQEARKDR